QIHDRNAHADVLRILKEEGAPEVTIFHCFSGDEQMARECAAEGYFMSFAGNLTFKNADELRRAAAAAPLELLLTETDAPFLTPHPHRGKPGGPYLTAITARKLAEVRGLSEARPCGTTRSEPSAAGTEPDPGEAGTGPRRARGRGWDPTRGKREPAPGRMSHSRTWAGLRPAFCERDNATWGRLGEEVSRLGTPRKHGELQVRHALRKLTPLHFRDILRTL